jgi:tetratricopeptide (TPR) repeat protein
MRRWAIAIGVVTAILVCVSVVAGAQDAEELFVKGDEYYSAGEYEKAIEYFTKAIEQDPECALCYRKRGNIHYALRHYDEAIADFSDAIEIDPEDVSTYEIRGLTYHVTGRYSDAVHDFTMIIELHPDNEAYYYYLRGSIYHDMGEVEHAISDLETACDMGENEACKALHWLGYEGKRKEK